MSPVNVVQRVKNDIDIMTMGERRDVLEHMMAVINRERQDEQYAFQGLFGRDQVRLSFILARRPA